MIVYVRTSGSIYEGDYVCTGVFATLGQAQAAPGGACELDTSWDYLGSVFWRDKQGARTWRREWGDDRDDIEEHDVALPLGYELVYSAHLTLVLGMARTYNRRPTEASVAYPADLPGAVSRWEKFQFAIDHVRESPQDVAEVQARAERKRQQRADEEDRQEYVRLYEKFGGAQP